MKRTIIYLIGLVMIISSNFYYAQCYPADAVPYAGTFNLADSPQGNYYINSGSGTIPNVPIGFKLWISGTAKYTLPPSQGGSVEICNGGIVTTSFPSSTTDVNLLSLIVGRGGVFNVSITGPSNVNSFFIGQLRENSVTSFCVDGPVNIFSNTWTQYIGSPTGKAWLVRMASGILNASQRSVSTSPNVFYVDYGFYFDPSARPITPSLPAGDPNNPFADNGGCDVAGLALNLGTYINPPSTNVTCTKPGLTTGTVSPAKFAVTTLNPNGIKDRLDNVSGSLFLESSAKGFVLPRTLTTGITSPAAGTLIYDTANKCIAMYDGSSWGCVQQTCIDNR